MRMERREGGQSSLIAAQTRGLTAEIKYESNAVIEKVYIIQKVCIYAGRNNTSHHSRLLG